MYIKNRRDTTHVMRCSSFQLLSYLESELLRNSPQFIYANRSEQVAPPAYGRQFAHYAQGLDGFVKCDIRTDNLSC